MARPREHDHEAARKGAVRAFLRGGFAATSLSDLEHATGLDRRQLYNEYADKQGVFLEALADFSDFAGDQFLSGLESADAGLDSVSQALKDLVDAADAPMGRLGCLICNTSREPIANSDERVQRVVQQYFDRIEKAYANALRNAVSWGELDLSPQERRRSARLLLATHVALCVMCRAGTPMPALRDIAEAATKAF